MNLLMFLSGDTEQLVLDNITYPNNPGYQNKPLMFVGLGNYQWSPLVWTVLDKTFISVSDTSSPNKYYIVVYDHFRKKVSNAIYAGLEGSGVNDIHHIASIMGTALNELFITETSFHGAAGTWKISKSVINYDINNFNAWTNTGVNEFTYHQLKMFANGDIYNIGRLASISGNYMYNDLYKSVNNGASFALVHRILDWGPSGDNNRFIPYPGMIYSNDDVIRLWVNNLLNTYPPSVRIGGKESFYLETIDGGTTWRNIDNSWSKDVIATSPLTLTEMEANMSVIRLSNNNDTVRLNEGAVIGGTTYLIGGSGTDTNSPLALYYWSGSAWIQNVIIVAGHTILPAYAGGNIWNNKTSLFKFESGIDLICEETVSTKAQMSRFRTLDNGLNWSFVEQITSNDADHWQSQCNKNISNTSYNVVACTVENGDNTDRLFVKAI